MGPVSAAAVPGGPAGNWCWVHGSWTPSQSESGLLDAGATSRPGDPAFPAACENLLEEADAVVNLAAAAWASGRFIVRRRRAARKLERYDDLPGTWRQYHRTRDSAVSKAAIWVAHTDLIQIKRGRIMGKSENHHSTRFSYAIEGDLEENQPLSFRYQNRRTDERMVNIIIDVDHRPDLMIGFWFGEDFDRQPADGPIIYSRTELSKRRLGQIVARQYPRRCFCQTA